MSHRKRVLILSLLSLLGFSIGVILTSPYGAGLCGEIRYCFEPFDEIIGQPLGFFSIVIFFLSMVFLFVHEQKFSSWLHFAKYYLPIAALLIILMPTVDSTIGGFDKEFMTWLLAGIFFITSLGIIIFKRSLGRPISK